MKTTLFLFPLALLAACGGSGDAELDTPRTTVEAPLAGSWFTGTLSSIQYYDRNTGAWQNPNGSGFYFIFGEDGAYETGAIIDSTVYNCNMRLQGVEVGTVVADGDQLTLYRHWVRTHVINTCGNDGDREQGEAVKSVSWTVSPDENGLEWLTLGDGEIYRRW